MLTYQRPANSDGERAFIERFLLTLPNAGLDRYGNVHVVTDPASTTLFSAHTDSVHPKPNADFRQVLQIGSDFILSAKGNQQLGADNAAGCWVLMNLITANVPGTYIFHREEEVGGRGSHWLATHHETELKKFKRAIAFDRKGTHSIITEQSFMQCCSTSFAEALAKTLGMGHQLDDTGTFTDTANYTEIIPECTNISVGYQQEHTFNEHLNVLYVECLAAACLTVDWEALPTLRDPDAPDPYYSYSYRDYPVTYNRKRPTTKPARSDDDFENLYDLVISRADEVADLLQRHFGYTHKLLENDLDDLLFERLDDLDFSDKPTGGTR